MKNFTKFRIGMIGAALLSFGIYSCNTDEQISDLPQHVNIENDINYETQTETIPQVQEFYDNLKTIIFATEINKEEVARSLIEDDISLVEELRDLDLTDEDTEEGFSFYDMEEFYQISLIDQYMDESAAVVSNKIRLEPELIEYFARQNAIVNDVFQEYGVTSIETKVRDRRMFFESLYARIAFLQVNDENTDAFSNQVFSTNEAAISTRNRLAYLNAQRGDMVVALPRHGFRFQLISFDNKRFKVGHTGIVTSNITYSTSVSSLVFVEAWKSGGVQMKAIQNAWDESKFYLMEVRKKNVKVKFTWRRGVQIKVTYNNINKHSFASRGESYIGRRYITSLHEFFYMKTTAKNFNRFVCSSHVWLSAKRSVGVNLSNPLSRIVTPSDIYSDSQSFIKGQIINNP